MKRKFLLSIPVSFIVLSIMLIPTKAEAKGFGTETHSTVHDSGAGYCTRVTIKKFKVFWITVQETSTSTFGLCGEV